MIKKTLSVAALLAAGVTGQALAADINPCALSPCTNAAGKLPGTNIVPPGVDAYWHVLDGVRVVNDKITHKRGEFRLILVKDTGITGSSLTEAAMHRESAQLSYEGGYDESPVFTIDTVLVDSSGNMTVHMVDSTAKNKGKSSK